MIKPIRAENNTNCGERVVISASADGGGHCSMPLKRCPLAIGARDCQRPFCSHRVPRTGDTHHTCSWQRHRAGSARRCRARPQTRMASHTSTQFKVRQGRRALGCLRRGGVGGRLRESLPLAATPSRDSHAVTCFVTSANPSSSVSPISRCR